MFWKFYIISEFVKNRLLFIQRQFFHRRQPDDYCSLVISRRADINKNKLQKYDINKNKKESMK